MDDERNSRGAPWKRLQSYLDLQGDKRGSPATPAGRTPARVIHTRVSDKPNSSLRFPKPTSRDGHEQRQHQH